MRLIILITIMVLLLVGCSPPKMELDQKWSPLEAVVEDPTGITDSGVVMTTLPNVYVYNLKKWQENFPEGPKRDALLEHERMHALRQKEKGLTEWLWKYVTDKDFRWKEEQLGWRLELKGLQNAGYHIYKENVAKFLSGDVYTIFKTQMVTYHDAMIWIEKVLQEP